MNRSLPAVLACLLAGCGSSTAPTPSVLAPEPQPACSDTSRKHAWFGDLHVHTLFSIDAYFFNGINGPREAYRFAKGEIGYLPLGEEDPYTPARDIHLDRPLDFAATSDHSDFLGDWKLACEVDGTLPAGTNPVCNLVGTYLRNNVTSIVNGGAPPAFYILTTAAAPTPLTQMPWQEVVAIADEEYEPCTFSTFPGFEWTSQFHNQMIHRNVYFIGDGIPSDVPHIAKPQDITAQTSSNLNDDWRLYDWLEASCNPAAGCRTMAIVHNPNQSSGGMYLPRDPQTGLPPGRDGAPMTPADAQLRAKYDQVIEIFQHKGNSECGVGLEGEYMEGTDPACTLELAKNVCSGTDDDPAECAQLCTGDPQRDPDFCSLRTAPTFATGVCEYQGRNGGSGPAEKCVAPLDMARNILADGLALQNTLGVNPMRMGFVGSSDTHNGDPGNVAEEGFPGHGGVLDNAPRTQLGYWTCEAQVVGGVTLPNDYDPTDPSNCPGRAFLDRARAFNPGGLAGTWAPQNTRESLWSSFERGETFSTSGPRIRIRTAALWDEPPADICSRIAAGEDITGAAMMGDDLPLPAHGDGPYVVVWAQADELGLPLQSIDLVKSWVDAQNQPRVAVIPDVAVTAAPVDGPSRGTCEAMPADHPRTLCAVWKDPSFDAAQNAYWYARAFEIPSCRWSTRMCVAAQVDCAALDPANGIFPEDSGFAGYEGCCQISGEPGSFAGANRFNVITERAWASPIWYRPD